LTVVSLNPGSIHYRVAWKKFTISTQKGGSSLSPLPFESFLHEICYEASSRLNQEKPVLVQIQSDGSLRSIDRILLKLMRGGTTRIHILETLNGGDKTCHEIAGLINVSWGAVHQHLAKMRDAGLVAETSVGRISYYRSTLNGLRAIEVLAKPNGDD